MAKCVYNFKNETDTFSYDALVSKILESNLQDINNELDIVYSIATNQDQLINLFTNLKETNKGIVYTGKLSNKIGSVGDDSSIDYSKNKMSVLDFIDDPRFVDESGKQYLPQMNSENFIKNRAAILEEQGLSPEDALKKAKDEEPKWKQQRNDGIILHYILKNYLESTEEVKNALDQLSNLFSGETDLVKRIQTYKDNDTLLNSLLQLSKNTVIINPKGSKVIQTIPIKSTIKLPSGEEIEVIDSIDRVVVDQNGYIKVYKFKITEDNPINWGDRSKSGHKPKVEKYRYELAFIKQMLYDSGFLTNKDMKKVSLNLLVAQIEYDKELDAEGNLVVKEIKKPMDISMDINNDRSQMDRHIEISKKFINPKVKIEVTDEAIEKANAHMERVWVDKNIKTEATVKSVEQWIEDNKDTKIFKIEPTPGAANEYHWRIHYPGHEAIFIKEESEPESNTELIEKLNELLRSTEDHNSSLIRTLQQGIAQAMIDGYIDARKLRGFKSSAGSIAEMLNPYLNKNKKPDGTEEPVWEYLKDNPLSDYGILLFKNLKSGQIDIITLTNLNLNTKVQFKYGRTNLAGSYMSNIDSKQLPSTWGNIFAMKTLILLNYIIPQIEGDFKLGNLKVVSTFDYGKSQTFNIQNTVSEFYNPLMKIVETNTAGLGQFENNFKNANYIDPYSSLLSEFKAIVNGNSFIARELDSFKTQVNFIEGLTNDSTKISALIDLAQSINEQFCSSFNSADLAEKYYTAYSSGSKNQKIATLLVDISNTINKLRGDKIGKPEKIDKLTRMFMPTSGIPNNHFKIVKRYWTETSQRINSEAYNVGVDINKIVKELYDEAGYSQIQNKILGNQLHVFKNMYEDNSAMLFKNPYDNNNTLQSYERKFLKKALLIFAKYRYMNSGKAFKFTLSDIDSESYKKFVEKNSSWYFCVPLRKASTSSDIQSGFAFQSAEQAIKTMITNPKLWARRFLDDKAMDAYFKEHKANSDVTLLSVRNYFSYTEPDISEVSPNNGQRESNLSQHPDSRFYEHNVENLLRDFTFESVRSQNMNKMMVACKLLLMQLTLSGKMNNNLKDFESEIKFIEDFLKVNVFNIPLMESSELAIASYLLPVRKLVSRFLVAGNVASSIRDGFDGFGQIMARAVTKYGGTNIAAGDVMRAYSIVTKEMMFKLPLASLVSQLCIKYRMSNIDVSNVAEGMKTGRSGLVNFQDVMYKTLRDPDFLNRMTLFVAKCVHDGTWDAFSLDKEGVLKYDWKKDRRFNLLASNNKSNLDEFNKQKGLYYSLIRIWNEEHPDNQVDKSGDLPMPYTEKEMDAFHALSDNIWGAYDKSNKSMGEHSLLLMTFGMFTTWMNGGIKNYFMPLQESSDRIQWVHMRNNNGQLLYYDKDGGVTTENTGEPVYAQQPIFVQGIFKTLLQIYDVLKDGGSWDEVFGTKENPSISNRENMKKLGTDVTMTLIYLALIRAVLEALRDKQKEITDPHDFITNGICEVLYKGMYNSWDGFKGPLNLLVFLGDQTNPPVYTESISVARDLFKFVVGDMTILSFGSRHFAPIRAFRETIRDYQKE